VHFAFAGAVSGQRNHSKDSRTCQQAHDQTQLQSACPRLAMVQARAYGASETASDGISPFWRLLPDEHQNSSDARPWLLIGRLPNCGAWRGSTSLVGDAPTPQNVVTTTPVKTGRKSTSLDLLELQTRACM
jgi:hypothetical protein